MRETKRQQEERERNKTLQIWCRRLKNIAGLGLLPAYFVAMVITETLKVSDDWLIILISLLFTMAAFIAVILNFKLPKSLRIHTADRLRLFPTDYGPLLAFFITFLFSAVFIYACIRN